MRLTIFSLLIALFSACTFDFGKEGIVEGTMQYKINYLQDETENPLIGLMPSTLNMTFKNNTVLMEVEGWMGVFRSAFIKYGETGEAVTMLKMMGKKYYYMSNGKSGYMGMSGYDSIVIQFDDKKKKILEYDCDHAMAKIPDSNIEFDIYYTRQIDIVNPNSQTPFSKINGVLMEFQLDINGIKMHLEAKEINEREIPDETFEIPDDYEEVPKSEIDEIFASLV
ncbi:MAG: hypothetical protein JEZ09_00560 [Salinivirgaceae bacterium]|nr:hypothetical protein [Salinivirgaceae bacterium]